MDTNSKSNSNSDSDSHARKIDNISLASDIEVLFSRNLVFKENAESLEQKLRQGGVVNFHQLLQLTISDLIAIGICDSDARTIFNQAKQMVSATDKTPNKFKDNSSWLKAYNLERFEPNFANIQISMVPFIRRSDLTANLGIPMSDTEKSLNKVWDAIQELPFRLPPPLETIDDSRELICTTTESPITVDLNDTNFKEMIARADKQQSSIKVSFVGDTGAGKSLIITQLLNFDDRIRYGRGPLVASPGQLEATTSNVCVYSTTSRDGKHNFMLLDFEGAFGGIPRRIKSLMSKHFDRISSQTTDETVKQFTQQRDEVVKTVFPQLAYLISNIVVLIDKQPPHHTGYAEKLTKFAELNTLNSGTGEKPFLIVIQNFVDPESQKGGEQAYSIEQSTADFNECIQRQRKTQELLQHYREICFIRLPSWTSQPILFDQQICLLQEQLAKYAEILKKDSWFAKNFWSDYLWFNYLKLLCNEFKQSPRGVNVPKLIASLVKPQLSSLRRILNFWLLIWTPPVVGKETERQLLEAVWKECCDLILEHFAFLVFEELKKKFKSELNNEDDLNRANVKGAIMRALQEFCDEIFRYSPCLYQLPNGKLCGIAKEWHTTGHYGMKTGKHDGPALPFGLVNIIQTHCKKLLKLTPAARIEECLNILQKALQRKSMKERQNLKSNPFSFCMVCLRTFKKNRPLVLMKCGHVICETCSHLTNNLSCPVHEEKTFFVNFTKRLPDYSSPRVLSLDGGGVRGIVLIRILEQIEKMTGYRIHELFDLIVGSGIGGIIALLVGLKREPVSNYVDFFMDYPQKLFKTDLISKIIAQKKYKYSSKSLKTLFQELFGEIAMSECCGPENALVAVTAFRKTSTSWGPVFFTNYVHGTGLEETKEYAGRRLIHNCQLWQAAAVSAATPPLFRPQTVGEDDYIDGSFIANNPSIHALEEANNLWKRPIDCLISIGTGFCQTTPKTGDARLNWSNRQVDLVSETMNVANQVAAKCHQNNIFYSRLCPEIQESLITDSTSKTDFHNISKLTLDYLTKNVDELKTICQRLIASLLYVSKIKQENDQSATISIHCRHPKFRVSSLLGGPQWQLECVILKGNCTWNITYSSNLSQNPIASIHMEKIDAGTSIRIDIVIGNYGFVISGGYVRLKSLPKKIKATKLNLSGVNPVKTEKPSRPRSAILKSPKSKQHQPRIVAVKEINAKSRSMSDVFRSDPQVLQTFNQQPSSDDTQKQTEQLSIELTDSQNKKLFQALPSGSGLIDDHPLQLESLFFNSLESGLDNIDRENSRSVSHNTAQSNEIPKQQQEGEQLQQQQQPQQQLQLQHQQLTTLKTGTTTITTTTTTTITPITTTTHQKQQREQQQQLEHQQSQETVSNFSGSNFPDLLFTTVNFDDLVAPFIARLKSDEHTQETKENKSEG